MLSPLHAFESHSHSTKINYSIKKLETLSSDSTSGFISKTTESRVQWAE